MVEISEDATLYTPEEAQRVGIKIKGETVVLYFPRLTALSCRQCEQPFGDGLDFLVGDPGA